jgi:hypothetical protein
VAAAPLASQQQDSELQPRQLGAPYSLPQNDQSPIVRAAGITTKRATFLYGPGIGGGPYSPTGPLGVKYIAADSALTDSELAAEHVVDTADSVTATTDSAKVRRFSIRPTVVSQLLTTSSTTV